MSSPESRKIRLIDADPDLARGLGERERELVRRYAVADLVGLEAGPWAPPAQEEGQLGLLVLEGLILRSLELTGSTCAELVGDGDVLRPWDPEPADGSSTGITWTALTPVRFAVLDRRFATLAGRCPALLDVVLARVTEHSRRTALQLAITHVTRVDMRLQLLLWFLADRWGRVAREGVVVPLVLTHLQLAQLVGAHRPSVTTALGELVSLGEITRRRDGSWLLHGRRPDWSDPAVPALSATG